MAKVKVNRAIADTSIIWRDGAHDVIFQRGQPIIGDVPDPVLATWVEEGLAHPEEVEEEREEQHASESSVKEDNLAGRSKAG